MDTEKIADKARKSIGKFCIEECKSFCCRKGYLVMTPIEAEAVMKGKENGALKQLPNGKLSLYLSKEGCPRLKDFKCTIHKNQNRPLACKQFPLFIKDNTIMLTPRCLAAKMNLFYPYVKRLMKLGYKIIECEPFYSMDDGNAVEFTKAI